MVSYVVGVLTSHSQGRAGGPQGHTGAEQQSAAPAGFVSV